MSHMGANDFSTFLSQDTTICRSTSNYTDQRTYLKVELFLYETRLKIQAKNYFEVNMHYHDNVRKNYE